MDFKGKLTLGQNITETYLARSAQSSQCSDIDEGGKCSF